MAPVASPAEQQIVLHNIAWETYERLPTDHQDRLVPRFTYDRGELEILGPSPEHEIVNRTLALLVELVAAECAIETLNVGSMTVKQQELKRGLEPGSSFYNPERGPCPRSDNDRCRDRPSTGSDHRDRDHALRDCQVADLR